MKRSLWCLVAWLMVWAAPVHAQTITQVNLQVQAAGSDPATATPLRSVSIPLSAFVCNQTPIVPPTGAFVPTRVEYDDQGPTKACIATIPPFVPPIPAGTGYVLTATFTYTLGGVTLTTDRSAASNPFPVAAPAPPPTPVVVPPGHLRVLP